MFYNAASACAKDGQAWYGLSEVLHAGGENDEGKTCLIH
jgi:hypothetical protein